MGSKTHCMSVNTMVSGSSDSRCKLKSPRMTMFLCSVSMSGRNCVKLSMNIDDVMGFFFEYGGRYIIARVTMLPFITIEHNIYSNDCFCPLQNRYTI